MANRQTITWTALPNGTTDAGDGRLSIFVAHRLLTDDPSTTLLTFPDLVDWPATLRTATFTVVLDGVATPVATQPDPAAWEPSSAHWAALFKPTTPVRSFRFVDRSTYGLISYSVDAILDRVLDEYHRLGLMYPDDLPTYEQLTDPEVGLRTPSLLAEAGGQPLSDIVNDPAALHDRDARLFAELLRFHRPRYTEPVDLQPPDLEFHDVVAALGQFPMVLRDLGLVVDLLVPGIGAMPPGGIRVEASWSPATPTTTVAPRTRWQTSFVAMPRPTNPDLSDGLLLLGTGRFRAFQVDVDGAAIKLATMADSLHRYDTDPTKGSPPNTGLPALRSAGIAVAREGRAQELKRSLDSARQRNDIAIGAAAGDIELYAEDLVRGYRPLVLSGPQWYSLCRRRETHRFLDADIDDNQLSQEADGWVSSAGTESAGPSPNMHLHEVIFRWDGWSLGVPRPSAGLIPRRPGPQDAGEAKEPDVPTRERLGPPPHFRLETTFGTVPGSLPRLRFGQDYQIAAQAVDLAGNALPGIRVGDPDVTLSATCLRYEPAIPPTVILTAPLSPQTSPGESLNRLVVRTDNSGPDGDATPADATTERHLAAPMGSQLLAETHGVFDGQDPQASYDLIISRERVLPEAGDGSTDPLVPIADLQPDGSIALPYLPDPIATGVTLYDLPGLSPGMIGEIYGDGPLDVYPANPPEARPASLVMIETLNEGVWHSPRSFRIRLDEGTGAPAWDANGRVLSVQVPKGTIRTLRFSSSIRHALQDMAMWREKRDTASADAFERFSIAAHQGRHWSLTPDDGLTLVHATRQPVASPKWEAIEPTRATGSTAAFLHGIVWADYPSTGEIEIVAESEEWVDVGPAPDERTTRRMQVATLRIAPRPIADDTDRQLAIQLEAPPDGEDPVRHEFGDTRFRRVHYRAVGLSRFVEYFSPGTADMTRTSEFFTVDIPASARPEPPRVRSIIPTFSWSREDAGLATRSIRHACSLRVYLDRPWYSSGGDERLGVVVLPWPSDQQPDPLATVGPYATRHGRDPLRHTLGPTSGQVSSYVGAVERVEEVGLLEVAGGTVDVAAHEVRFDRERDCWYADITIRSDSRDDYFPFVRLALARYQPHGLNDGAVDLRLSRVVTSDPVQLLPNRTVSISPDFAEPGRLFVQVNGQVYWASFAEDGSSVRGMSVVEVSVERRRSDIADDVLGWEPDPNAMVEADPVEFSFPVPADPGPLLWTGRVTALSGVPLRLVVREYEELPADDPEGTSPTGVVMARRLVYADTVPL